MKEECKNENKKDIKEFLCHHCGNKTEFDLNKCPINISFDYKCKECGAFNKIKLVVNDENLIKKYHANFIKNKNQIKKDYFNDNVFTIENKIDSFWEGEARKIGEQIVCSLTEKSYHYILVVLSNLNTYEKAEKYFEENKIKLSYSENTKKSVIETFVKKVVNCNSILQGMLNNKNNAKF